MDAEGFTELINETAEYLHDKGHCQDDCPFCTPPVESDDG